MDEIVVHRIRKLTPAKVLQIPAIMAVLCKRHPTLDLKIRGGLLSTRVLGTPKFVLPIKV